MAKPLAFSPSASPRHCPIHATATERSEDSKLTREFKVNHVSTSSASQFSCPDTCPFFGNGCYAETGFTAYTTRRLNSAGEATPETIATVEAAAIRRLTGRNILRLHLVGDCITDEAALLVSTAAGEHTAKHGKAAWTYTHAWRSVTRASWQQVSVLASCETESDVELALERGYATAMVVRDDAPPPKTVAGTILMMCPQQTGKAPDCVRCGGNKGPICTRDQEFRGRVTVGFKGHGARVKALRLALDVRGA